MSPDEAAMNEALEAVLFVSDEPLSPAVLAQALDSDRRTVERLCQELAGVLAERGSGIVLRNVAGGWQLSTRPEVAPVVEKFVLSSRHARMTKASLETLAIVAYKQPVARHQIAAIRGVDSDGVIRSLCERGLIQEVGREDVPGRPILYGTTPEFLQRMGLASLAGLPSLAPLLDAADGDEADGIGAPEGDEVAEEGAGETLEGSA